MNKCSVNIGKLMKAFHKKIYFEWGGEKILSIFVMNMVTLQ